MEGFKTCRICGESKPLEAFYRNSHHVDGRATQCKACEAERKHEAWINGENKRWHARYMLSKGAVMTRDEIVQWLKERQGKAARALFDAHNGPDEVRDTRAGEMRGIRFCLECLAGDRSLHYARTMISQRYEWERARQAPFWRASNEVLSEVLGKIRERMLMEQLLNAPKPVDPDDWLP